MNLDISTFENLKDSLDKMNISEEFGQNFSMHDMAQFTIIGDKMYQFKIKTAWERLDVNKIISELEYKFPQLRDLNISTLFDKEKYPKYIRTDIISLLKDNLPFNLYLTLSDEIDKYWSEHILPKIKPVEESFEEIDTLLSLKFQKLENYPNVVSSFDLFDKIKEEVMEVVSQKISEWKENDYHSLMKNYSNTCNQSLKYQILQQIKEDLFKRLETFYPIIFKQICTQNGVTDPNIIDTLLTASGVNKEMIKFSISLFSITEAI